MNRTLGILWNALLITVLFPGLSAASVEDPPDCPKARVLCLKADRTGEIDLENGVTLLDGNVSGIHRQEEVTFFSERLRIFRNSQNQWSRMELESRVRIRQGEARATANHTVIEQGQVLLFGNATIHSPPSRAEGEEILLERIQERTTIRGIRDRPLLLLLHRDQPPPKRDIPEGMPPPKTDTIRIRAGEAVMDRKRGTILMAGDVEVVRVELDWRLDAQHVRLEFDQEQNLTAFRAEGDVRITQAGRKLQSDIAQSRNHNQTILLTGNASIEQKGEFSLKSNQIEVYADASKGVVQTRHSREKMTLSFDLDTKKNYQLTRNKMLILASRNVPRTTLDKLYPLLDRKFSDRRAFTQAAGALLDQEEISAWLDVIADQSR